MKSIIKRLVPESGKQTFYKIRFALKLAKNYYYDFKRYLKFSSTSDPYQSKIRHQGRILATYHVIEKGLSLKSPRVGFGVDVVNYLVRLLTEYQEKYGLDEVGQVALNTLFSYYNYNLSQGLDNQELYKNITEIKNKIPKEVNLVTDGGVIKVTKEQIKEAANVNFKEFVNARHSIRNFDTSNDVDIRLIEEAVSIALKTPSVCNRQTWKLHIFSDDDLKRKVLSHQNGNRGFGDTASKVLVVTTDLNLFIEPAERNQCWVDGGMFAMSLIYALHSLGVGTCCLNWSATYERDQAVRVDAGIGESEAIIMMIAVGNLPDSLNVARSSRRKVEEVLTVN